MQTYFTTIDARHAMNAAADERGAAVITSHLEGFRVFAGETIEAAEREARANGYRGYIIDSKVQS